MIQIREPELRFKADDGSEFLEWEEKRLGEVCEYGKRHGTGQNYVGTENMFSAFGGVIIENTESECNGILYSSGDILMSNIRPYLKKVWLADREGVCSTDVLVFRPIKIESEYLYCLIASDFFITKVMSAAKGSKMPRGDKKHIMEIPVSVPSLPEQKKIASFLSTIDEIIQSTESELTAWQERKKGVMQKIFNREVRFKADDGSEFPEWEEKRLGEVFVERSERSADNLDLLSVTIANGVIRQNESDKRNVSSVDKSNYKRVYIGDLAYNSMRMWQGAEGVSAYDGIVSPAYTVLVPKKQEYVYFYEYMFKRTEMLHIFQRYSQGLTSDTWNLKYPALSHISVVVPSLLEQKKIAECLSSIDDVISNIQAELSAWKEFKKGLLQQMFV